MNQTSSVGLSLRSIVAVLICSVLTSCDGFFVNPGLSSITVTPTTPSITVGNTKQMTASGTYNDGSTKDITTSVGWSSSDTSVAAVSDGGVVTGVSAGTSSITGTSGSITGSTTVTISVANLRTIAISPTNASINSGQTQAFTATGTLANGTTVDLTRAVTWSSSDTSVATINSNGVATGQTVTSTQNTNIKAKSGSITSNTAVLTVVP